MHAFLFMEGHQNTLDALASPPDWGVLQSVGTIPGVADMKKYNKDGVAQVRRGLLAFPHRSTLMLFPLSLCLLPVIAVHRQQHGAEFTKAFMESISAISTDRTLHYILAVLTEEIITGQSICCRDLCDFGRARASLEEANPHAPLVSLPPPPLPHRASSCQTRSTRSCSCRSSSRPASTPAWRVFSLAAATRP